MCVLDDVRDVDVIAELIDGREANLLVLISASASGVGLTVVVDISEFSGELSKDLLVD